MTTNNYPKQIEINVKMNLETSEVYVSGPLQAKPLCIRALALAINAVVDHTPPVIQPVINGKIITPSIDN